MQTNELRLGNYVNVPREDQSPFRIDLFEFNYKHNCKVGMNALKYSHPNFLDGLQIDGHPLTWELEDLKPIPLTEEWLLKFGFEKHTTNPFWYRKKQLCISILGIVEIIQWDNNKVKIDFEVNFIHQLQNLCFFLTNQELEAVI